MSVPCCETGRTRGGHAAEALEQRLPAAAKFQITFRRCESETRYLIAYRFLQVRDADVPNISTCWALGCRRLLLQGWLQVRPRVLHKLALREAPLRRLILGLAAYGPFRKPTGRLRVQKPGLATYGGRPCRPRIMFRKSSDRQPAKPPKPTRLANYKRRASNLQ